MRFKVGGQSWTLLTGASSITVAFNLNGPIRPLTFELRARTEDATTGQLDINLNQSEQTGHQSSLDISGTDYQTYKVAIPKGSLQEHNILKVSLGLVSASSITAFSWTPPRLFWSVMRVHGSQRAEQTQIKQNNSGLSLY